MAFSVLAAAGVSGCGGINERTSQVRLSTNPPGATCLLEGRDGYSNEVVTPVKIEVPVGAAPLDVTCGASRYRTAYAKLDINQDGWFVRNTSALANLGADSLSLIGIDLGEPEVPHAPKTNYSVEMEPVTPRMVRTHQRDGDIRMDIAPGR